MKTIKYTEFATDRTVKPTETTFENKTGEDITIYFLNRATPSLVIKKGETSKKISTTIDRINYRAKYYYAALDNNFVIPANQAASLEFVDRESLKMTIA